MLNDESGGESSDPQSRRFIWKSRFSRTSYYLLGRLFGILYQRWRSYADKEESEETCSSCLRALGM
ncbi:UNVERIFIED_CONTAM: hypothetical protein Sangu_2906100 [Sesamum angustifolium]|uniref:Uncharacterized protein n=1 Tax=Sesamum angustifolium TaxID=2727405 RepID=A0AAW2INK1_9LAMI